jgi:ABC-type taurine transport system substrate-binding protein
MVAAIQRGELTKTAHVWNPALGGWTQAGQVPQLAGYFAAASPPPPPPM